MQNRNSAKTAQQLIDLLSNMASVFDSPQGAAYHLSPAAISGLEDEQNALFASLTEANQLAVRARTANAARDAARLSAIATLGRVATTLYNDPLVTPVMISALGLEPRADGPSRPTLPERVTGLEALPNVDGSVRLKFSKGGNRISTVYGIEASADGATWTPVVSVTRATVTLSGYAPGVATWFRVVASNGVGAALPSATAGIYAPTTALRVEEGGRQAA